MAQLRDEHVRQEMDFEIRIGSRGLEKSDYLRLVIKLGSNQDRQPYVSKHGMSGFDPVLTSTVDGPSDDLKQFLVIPSRGLCGVVLADLACQDGVCTHIECCTRGGAAPPD